MSRRKYAEALYYRLFSVHGAAHRAAGRDPLRRGLRPAPVADVCHRHRGEYAACAHHILLRPPGAGVGEGQAGHRAVLHLLPGEGRAGRGEAAGQGGAGSILGAAAVRGHPAAGNRRVDGYAGRQPAALRLQEERAGLHGRRGAGGHHHGRAERGGLQRVRRGDGEKTASQDKKSPEASVDFQSIYARFVDRRFVII